MSLRWVLGFVLLVGTAHADNPDKETWIASHQVEIDACFWQNREAGPVEIRVTIGKKGRASRIDPIERDLMDPFPSKANPAFPCLKQAMSSWDYHALGGERRQVDLRLERKGPKPER